MLAYRVQKAQKGTVLKTKYKNIELSKYREVQSSGRNIDYQVEKNKHV